MSARRADSLPHISMLAEQAMNMNHYCHGWLAGFPLALIQVVSKPAMPAREQQKEVAAETSATEQGIGDNQLPSQPANYPARRQHLNIVTVEKKNNNNNMCNV